MFVCRCKEKIRYKNGKVKLYWLEDSDGVYYLVKPVELKNKILSKEVLVENLYLSSDGR